MGFFNNKKRTYILPDIEYRRRVFNGKVGPRWFRPRGHAHGPKYIKHQQKICGIF
jgi:hypothetical protein